MKDFIELVTKMRKAQKDYFATRDPNALAESKLLERKVDITLNRLNGTPDLFDGDDFEKRVDDFIKKIDKAIATISSQ